MRTLPELRAAVRSEPGNTVALVDLGAGLTERGEYRRAIVCLRAALRNSPENPQILSRLATALIGDGNAEEAILCLEQAAARNSDGLTSWQALGRTYFEHLDRPQDALRCFLRAIEYCPDDVDHYKWAARCLLTDMSPEAAVDCLCRRTFPSGNNVLRIRQGVAAALIEIGRYHESLDAFNSIVREHAGDAFSLRALGQIHGGLRDYESAGRYFDRALQADGNDRDVIVSRILHFAKLGDMDRAREIYRSRTRLLPVHLQDESLKRHWYGQNLQHKTVHLIVGDIYYGDALQFVRLARSAKRMGATVIIQGPKRVRPLLRTVPGADFVIAHGDTVPRFDYSAVAFWTLFSLQVPFHEMVDPDPYVQSDPELRSEWRRRLLGQPGFKIGINWRGSSYFRANRYACRSMPLEMLRPLASIPGVTLYSLQTGPGSDELTRNDPAFPAIDLRPDFSHTAAVMDELDLVVTIDTSIAHLAGALGRPTFLMLPYEACFRWMVDRDDTPWYRSMRLFRQSAPGDWSDVVACVSGAVRKMIECRAATR